MRRVFTLFLVLFSFSMVFSQAGGNFWRDVTEVEIDLAYRQAPQNGVVLPAPQPDAWFSAHYLLSQSMPASCPCLAQIAREIGGWGRCQRLGPNPIQPKR